MKKSETIDSRFFSVSNLNVSHCKMSLYSFSHKKYWNNGLNSTTLCFDEVIHSYLLGLTCLDFPISITGYHLTNEAKTSMFNKLRKAV